jgi:NAD(P)-dependent dehydrogenase (short-subunit alcohol dehydrogenase family)
MRLKDRVAVVTGAGQGIGRAIAEGLAREGAAVMIGDLQEDNANMTARLIGDAGGRARAARVDVSDLGACRALIADAVEAFGRLDILVNNAGIGVIKPLLDVTESDWDRQMAVNVKAPFFLTQEAARVFVRQGGGGRVVNVASTSAFVASSSPLTPYDVSKAGVRMLTISSAVALAPHGVNVNAIAPGTIDTDLTRAVASPDRLAAYAKEKIPIGRIGQPQDLVGAVIFLCSDESSYVTGHVLVVDGGWLLL